MMPTGKGASESKDDWLSIPEAVRHSGLARQTVLTLGHMKELEIREFAGRLWVSKRSIDNYVREGTK